MLGSRSALASVLLLLLGAALGGSCAEEDEGTEADRLGVGAQCQTEAQCQSYAEDEDEDSDVTLRCLDQFKGGYCGIIDCIDHRDCPDGSGCVAHDDGFNYCFLLCGDKVDCNINRSADFEANCSSNVTWVGDERGKACVPPEGT